MLPLVMIFEHIRGQRRYQKKQLALALGIKDWKLQEIIAREEIDTPFIEPWAAFLEIIPHPEQGYKSLHQYNARERIYRATYDRAPPNARQIATDISYFGNYIDVEPIQALLLKQTLSLTQAPLHEIKNAILDLRSMNEIREVP